MIYACTEAGFVKPVTEGQCFVTVHDEEVTDQESAGLCREHIRPRDEAHTRARG